MRNLKLASGDPLCLILAADAQLDPTDYLDDQIWELSLGQGLSPVLELSTTFGLRVNAMTLFPRFTWRGAVQSSPREFFHPPIIKALYPNYIHLTFEPFEDIQIKAEYWIVKSHVAAGRITIENPSREMKKLSFEMACIMDAPPPSNGMIGERQGANHILQGKAGRLNVVFFMTGGPQVATSPFPGLYIEVELLPGISRQLTWTLAAHSDLQEAQALTRLTSARSWDAEAARIEMQNMHRTVEIQTGDPEWDIAFALGQNYAASCIMTGSGLKKPSFVLSRRPDLGYSNRNDGKDYPDSWNGQTAMDAWYLSQLLLPAGADLIRSFIDNFMECQNEEGQIDFKPGLGGQRTQFQAQPLLASLVLQVGLQQPDRQWLEKIFDPLMRFMRCWFNQSNDRDQDGFPEWQHPIQTGLDHAPLFNIWHPPAKGIEISYSESPALGSFLYRECRDLIEIARIIGREDEVPWLIEHCQSLKQLVESTWDTEAALYHYRDTWTHLSHAGQQLLEFNTNGNFILNHESSTPRRLVVHFDTSNEYTRYFRLVITGRNHLGAVREEVEPRQIPLQQLHGAYTTRQTFLLVEKIEVSGLLEFDRGRVIIPNYTGEDITLLLPLWAGIPDRDRAEQIIQHTIPDEFLQEYGIPTTRCSEPSGSKDVQAGVQPLWNTFVAEGMLAYGYRGEAADLPTRVMNGVLSAVKESHAFREYYDGASGAGRGDFHHLRGLPPVGLFLKILGIDHIDDHGVNISGWNPFPWPVTVKYNGITVSIGHEECTVTFPAGQNIKVKGAGPHYIYL
jgi:hypothetical protein